TLLTIMSEESVRLERLVRELLDFARPLAPSLEPESLRAVIEGAVDAASRAVGENAPRVTTEIASDLPPVRLDASMIRRAIVNLYPPPWKLAGPGEPPPAEDGPPKEYRDGDLDADFYQTPYGLFSLGAQAIRAGHQVKLMNLSSYAWSRVEEIVQKLDAEIF